MEFLGLPFLAGISSVDGSAAPDDIKDTNDKGRAVGSVAWLGVIGRIPNWCIIPQALLAGGGEHKMCMKTPGAHNFIGGPPVPSSMRHCRKPY
ncbi:hypothetical protein CYMTET_54201 [Cymbomonas tetramitiformis]|uniref:Uncharacterized protein n=1 Tax=Cymbomonas tetramitiformis TaxID=36881 RepID=A0AAE0EPU1_9CHLO|nr:hypothetical protein CYMTET_54201 [Cymbomonas tetramitiformis]